MMSTEMIMVIVVVVLIALGVMFAMSRGSGAGSGSGVFGGAEDVSYEASDDAATIASFDDFTE